VRWLRCVFIVSALEGCSFQHGAVSSDRDGALSDATDGPATDVPRVDATGSCGGKVWFTDFSSDPTALDVNGDTVADWMLRDTSAFPTSQLVGGVWQTPSASQPLDSQPKQTFTTRTRVHVRMRSITTSGARGAVFWINVGYDGSGTFAPLFFDAKLQGDGTQSLLMMRKTSGGVEQMFGSVTGLATDFVDVDLDIDPATLGVSYVAAGVSGSTTLNRVTSNATDEWATVVAYSGAAEFDSLRVEVCP